MIAAPRHAIDGVLHAHPEVRALVDHEWIRLLVMDDEGRITHTRGAAGCWAPV